MTESAYAARRTLTVPAESIEFLPGTVIGEYKVSSLMIEGSQATLFRISDRASAPYLMRVYFDGCAPCDALAECLLHSHEDNLCNIKAVGEHDGHKYDVVPILKSLPDINKLTENEQIKLIESEAQAVKSFHKTGFCHLDIKIEHFMQDGSKNIKLIDIASAKKIGSPAPENPSRFLPLDAHSGTVKPESDLFSFGVAVLEQFYPDFLAGKTGNEVSTVLSSPELLQSAVERLPSRIRDDIRLLLSDNPEARNECRWFRDEETESDRIGGECYDLQQVTEAVKVELLAIAVFCAPNVFTTTVKSTARNVDFQNAASLMSFLVFLRNIPKVSEQVNYTTLELNNVIPALNRDVITDHNCLSKTDPVKTLHDFQKKDMLYIFDRHLIGNLDEQGAVISEQKEKRAFAALKIIGIVLGVILCIGIAIVIIIAVLYLLMIIIGIIFVIGLICLLLNGS